MDGGILILIAGGAALVLYLMARLWLAEHDRALVREMHQGGTVIESGAYGCGIASILAGGAMMAGALIIALWLMGMV